MTFTHLLASTAGALCLAAAPALAQSAAPAADWTTFHGNLAAQKYSPADQITPANVGSLTKAWEFHTGDVADGSGDKPVSYFNSTPIFANDTLYIGSAFYRIFALDPATGQQKWVFDTKATLDKALTQPGLKTRGVAYWQAENPVAGEACQKRVYMGTQDAKLYAVDADTGKACEDFGDKGVLDINQWNTTNDKWPLSILQPPTIYKDQIFIGWSGYDFKDAVAPPGSVFAVDARTGKKNWEINFIPDQYVQSTGTANVWTNMTVDEERGILYMPVSSPSPNYYGGNRKEKLPLASTVTAVDTATGKVIWSQQLVHHDLWDYDPDAAPTLVDVVKDGKTVPALVQTTKQALLFVFNRETGEPIWPIEEEPVAASSVPGEEASPTQPIPDYPVPMVDPQGFPGIWAPADLASLGECSRMIDGLEYHGIYTPPTTGKGAIMWPSTTGGIEWGGGSYDPGTGVYVVNTSFIANLVRLVPREEYDSLSKDELSDGYSAQEGAPYGVQTKVLLNSLGMPCWKPPYGAIAAYDMHSGKQLWKRPFGHSQRWGFYMPESWGSPTIGGPAQTASGLIFIGATMDGYVHALSQKTGEELWSDVLEAPVVANPAVYTYKGREYVTFIAGGNHILKPDVSDQVVTYALPDDRIETARN
jgi:quinoprotein glucose dehydrogenase